MHSEVDRTRTTAPTPTAHPVSAPARGRFQTWWSYVRKTRLYRLLVALLGLTIVAVGLLLVPLPGPGWLVVFLGLAVLGSEFLWARRLRNYGRALLHRWAQWLRERSWRFRLGLGAGSGALVLAVVWGWLAWTGLPSWTPTVVTAQLQQLPGL